jgi:hypothetical protein
MEMATGSIMNGGFVKFSPKTGHYAIRLRVGVGCKRGDGLIRTVYSKDIADKGTGGNPCDPFVQRGSLFHDRVNTAPGALQNEIWIGLGSPFCCCSNLKRLTGLHSLYGPSKAVKERGSHCRGTDIN